MTERHLVAKGFGSYQTMLWLVMAAFFLFFSNGLYIIFLATWLAPVFLIRFLRSTRLIIGIATGLFINIVITILAWHGMIPIPGTKFLVVGGLIGFISFVPYLIDRLMYKERSSLISTLVFPCAWVGFEYSNSLFNPYATWGSLAYTQFDGPLAFLQLVSITGIWGPVFLITWFASIINWCWEYQFSWPSIKRGLGIYLGILIFICFAGEVRLGLFSPREPTVRVASIISPFEWDLSKNISDPTKLATLRKTTLAVQGELLNLSKQAALADADVIFWNEAAAPVFEADEKTLIKKAAKLSENLGVYLMISLYTRPGNYPNQSLQNKVVMMDSEGQVRYEYFKSKPVPGENAVPGDGQLKSVATPFGRIGTAICYDMDFPGLIRQAGKKNIDLMIVPADDWEKINPIHTYMASLRAIENGFSLVRSTKEGLSAAFDYQGRLLASLDEFRTEKKIMFADLPIKGSSTLYSAIGDIFAWICMIGLVALAIWKKVTNRKVDAE